MGGLIELIPTLGFPIIACVSVAYYFTRILEKFLERQDEEAQRHKEETDKLAEALNGNTMVLQKLIDKLDMEGIDNE